MASVTCCLGPDCAGTVLSGRLAAARSRLDVAVYELGPYYLPPLLAARSHGAAVRVLLDHHPGANSGALPLLARAGIGCRLLGSSKPGDEAHWKLLQIDGTVAVGTGNLLKRDAPRDPDGRLPPEGAAAMPGTREWWALVDGCPGLVTQARGLFEVAWSSAGPAPPTWPELAPPEIPPIGVPRPQVGPLRADIDDNRLRLVAGGTAVADLLLDRVAAARGRVLVTVPYVHPGAPAVVPLLAALEQAAGRGIDTRLLLGRAPGADVAAVGRLRLDIRVMDPARCTTGHAKGAVIDETVLVASANWSGGGLGGNREVALEVDAPLVADYFAAALERDWGDSRPLG
ncbi:MAG: hypothetical protein E6J14_05295 [Chloroflexi bacterium]|nr:MAG: hypothetical protein E6J14_05295 [Chloroflexota bacterium]